MIVLPVHVNFTTAQCKTGDVLVKGGYPDLGAFVLEALKKGEKVAQGGPPDVGTVLEQLVKAIPGFQDMTIINGQRQLSLLKSRLLILLNCLQLSTA